MVNVGNDGDISQLLDHVEVPVEIFIKRVLYTQFVLVDPDKLHSY